jgi:uncharacterized repeat protein (TIGR03803 family)
VQVLRRRNIVNYKKFLGAASAALLIVIVVTQVLAPGAWAQGKYKTLHTFTGGKDGSFPYAGLIFDAVGNLYGATEMGGKCFYASDCGVVFKLTASGDGSWTESVLHTFCSLTNCRDGAYPEATTLIFDAAGNLYGTTRGGGAYGGGTIFKLTPNSNGSWTESVLYSFCSLTNCSDGSLPYAGLIFDAAGNLYGATLGGGNQCFYAIGCGVVFKLTASGDGSWTESVLHTFCSLTNCSDGENPYAGLIFDQAGNLYGATEGGGNQCFYNSSCGVVFKLTPNSNGNWTESVLYSFCSLTNCRDGAYPEATTLIFDAAGNLYGTTGAGGPGGSGDCGVVFKLAPNTDGRWTETVLHGFTCGKDGGRPQAGLVFDRAGNLYGTTEFYGSSSCNYGSGCGVVFRLTPSADGGWREEVLHIFLDHPGAWPYAGVILDAAGNVYGTTYGDAEYPTCSHYCGSVYEITP